MSKVEVELREHPGGPAEIAGIWNELARRTGAGPFQSIAWATAWWNAYGPPLRFTPALIRQDGAVRGIIPFAVRGGELIFIGTRMSDLLDWILEPGLDEHAVLAAFQTALGRADVPAKADLRDMPATSTLLTALNAAGLRTGPGHPCPLIDVPESMPPYLRTRSEKLRRDVYKAARRATARDVGPLVVHRTPDSCRQAIAPFLRVHQAWWRMRGTPTELAGPEARTLLQEAIPSLAAAGRAELSCRYQGDDLVSAFLILNHDRTRYFYQGAFNPDYADIAPGVGHLAAEITRAAEDRCAEFDFLRGDEPYKLRWSTRVTHTHRFQGLLT